MLSAKGKLARVVVFLTIPLWVPFWIAREICRITWKDITEFLEKKERLRTGGPK